MNLLDEMALRDCERSTARDGCLAVNGYEGEERCYPCRARAELGVARSQRTCTNCGAALAEAIAWDDDRAIGVGVDGSTTCPPPPHKPHLYYNEFTKRGAA